MTTPLFLPSVRECLLKQRMEILAAWENALRTAAQPCILSGNFNFSETIRYYFHKALTQLSSQTPELPETQSDSVVQPHSVEARIHLLLTGEKAVAHALREHLRMDAKDWLEIRYLLHRAFSELLAQDVSCACEACSKFIAEERHRVEQLESAFERAIMPSQEPHREKS